ncbi:regulatory protein RecX [Aerosticca soli]|uniref:Regulatory protein RecX n=1 Tax=Aerosticca soli TaxID=2010829 RepID=A0A2Z6E5C0_9GAMM|nr:regulatory protein RecX [Aerosticca soli]MDI3258655.1 regulatory protein RecX [Nevskiaceae bacterium]BBD80300.1 regulatory protein RecX [Aerosticca soli]
MPGRDDKPRVDAYETAIALLARREHSQRELGAKLKRKGFSSAETLDALRRLGERRHQDDERFAATLIRHRASQGYGPLRLRLELKGHGLPEARIRALLDDADIDWNVLAAGQLRRRFGAAAAPDAAERARRAQFLLRRGFAAATVRQVTHADVDDADTDA